MPLLPAAAQGCFAHMCWDISPLMESEGQDHLLFFQRKLLAGGASVSTAEAWQQGRTFYPQIHPQVLVWWRVGWILTSSTLISCVLGINFQRVVTGERFCHCWGSLTLIENTQVGNHSLKLLVKSPRVRFSNHHWLPNIKKINELCIFKTKHLRMCLLLFPLWFLWFTYLCDCKHQGIVLLFPTWWVSCSYVI